MEIKERKKCPTAKEIFKADAKEILAEKKTSFNFPIMFPKKTYTNAKSH